MLNEFKQFAMRGNVVDLAVGVIIGAAFGKIVDSLVKDVISRLKEAGIEDVPVVVGGIIPPADAELLTKAGVARVYTPKDFDLTQIMRDITAVVDGAFKKAA